jgi:hypothetical protein
VGSECGGKDRRSGLSPSGIDINEYKTWGFLGIPYRKGSTPGLRIRVRGMPIIGNLFPSLTTIDSLDSLLSILGEGGMHRSSGRERPSSRFQGGSPRR